MRISGKEVGRAIRRALATPRSGPGIQVIGGSLNDTVSVAPGLRRAGGFHAEITGNTAGSTNQWSYSFVEVVKTGAGYGNWTTRGSGRTGTAWNTFEEINDAAGVQGNGIDIDGAAFPTDFDIQPAPTGTIVWVNRVVRSDTGAAEHWFSYVNGVDGTCDAAALDATVGFAAERVLDQTTVTSTYATVDKWSSPVFIDTAVMSFNATTGVLTVDPGTYRITVRGGVTTATNDSTLALRIREDTDGGGATTVGVAGKVEAVTTASDAVFIDTIGYLTVADGSTSEVTVEIARTAGTGTAKLEAEGAIWEAERVA